MAVGPDEPTSADVPTSEPSDASPKKPSWWRRNWKWFAGGVIGFIIGAVAGGGGNSSTTTSTKTVASVQTVTSTPGASVKTVTSTKTVTAAAPPPATSSTPTASGGGASTQSFSGNGGKNLGTITVSKPSTLKWTNDGDLFQLSDADLSILVNSQAHSGDTAVDPGTYHKVEVNAIGNWTIKIVPSG